nr:PREDICTED: zinc finger protein 497 [Equus przewalskii]
MRSLDFVIIPILWMRLPDLRAKFAWEKWGDADLVSSRAASSQRQRGVPRTVGPAGGSREKHAAWSVPKTDARGPFPGAVSGDLGAWQDPAEAPREAEEGRQQHATLEATAGQGTPGGEPEPPGCGTAGARPQVSEGTLQRAPRLSPGGLAARALSRARPSASARTCSATSASTRAPSPSPAPCAARPACATWSSRATGTRRRASGPTRAGSVGSPSAIAPTSPSTGNGTRAAARPDQGRPVREVVRLGQPGGRGAQNPAASG